MRSETFNTPDPPEVAVRLPSGSVRAESTADAQTTIEVSPVNDAAAELLAEVRVEERGGSSILVEVPERRGSRFLRSSPEFDVRIHCPHGASLDVRTASADLYARGRFGDVRAKTASGDVQVDEAERAVSVQSASGDVEIHSAGSADVTTTSGDVRLDTIAGSVRAQLVSGDLSLADARSSVEANTVSGDQRIDAVQGGVVALRSVSGDIAVGVRRGARVWLDVRSMSGDTVSDLDMSDDATGDGEAHVELRVNTVSGDVNIRRAGLALDPAAGASD